MAVVIRLLGLPGVAGSGDIRKLFSGLTIPDGGVHIIGGKLGEAFIIFATDEDARRAMSRTGGFIKNSNVKLFLSSKTEMQSTLEMSRRSGKKHPALPPGNDTLGAKKGAGPNKFDKGRPEMGVANNSGPKRNDIHPMKGDRKPVKALKEVDDVYLFLYGLPYIATEEDIRKFFAGLEVVEIIFLVRQNGARNGNAYVKFRSIKEATAAMSRNNEYMGTRFISLKKVSEEQWINAGGQVGGTYSKQPRKQRSRSRSPQNQQFYLHLKNLSFNVGKEDIKLFFGFPDLPDSQIKFLMDSRQERTREGFVMVKSEWQVEKCLSFNKGNLNGRPIFIFPIPRKEMLDLIESYESQPPRVESLSNDYPSRDHAPGKRCLYLRNFPFDVSKAEVLRFLAGFNVYEDDVFLLFDSNGVGLGEALVKFPTEQQAFLAESLNRQRFLDTEVLLRCISDEQMKEFGVFNDKPVENVLPRSVYRDEYNVRKPVDRFHDDLADRQGDFRGSPERFRGSNPVDFMGTDDLAGKYDRGIQSRVDYHHSLPYHGESMEGESGGTVHMKNLPYRITMEEILDFFYGYSITRESVDMKYTKNGMTTGLATVYFENYDEAKAAVNELNERPIGTRKIILSLTRK